MIKITCEITNSKAPPHVYYLSEGDVKVEYYKADRLDCFSGECKKFLTGGIKITAEGILERTGGREMEDDKGERLNWKEAFEKTLAAGCKVARRPDEIRARIAEMLDDDAREKFLGKPEKDATKYYPYLLINPYIRPESAQECDKGPELNYAIKLGENIGAEYINAAFRDKETRDHVLAFLNGDTK